MCYIIIFPQKNKAAILAMSPDGPTIPGIMLLSFDPNASVSYGEYWSLPSVYETTYDSKMQINSLNDDISNSIIFKLGNITNGQSMSFTYYIGFTYLAEADNFINHIKNYTYTNF